MMYASPEGLQKLKQKLNDPVKKKKREMIELLDDLVDKDEDYQKERHGLLKEYNCRLKELRDKYYKKNLKAWLGL